MSPLGTALEPPVRTRRRITRDELPRRGPMQAVTSLEDGVVRLFLVSFTPAPANTLTSPAALVVWYHMLGVGVS